MSPEAFRGIDCLTLTPKPLVDTRSSTVDRIADGTLIWRGAFGAPVG